jgi:phosphohistidine phosphatase
MNYKELFVLRHAKSSWDEPNKDDIDRALTTRGISDAYAMANRIKKQLHEIDMIITSHANRATHTATIFASIINYPIEKIRISPNIYETSEARLLSLVKDLPNESSRVMIVGHNPTFTSFVNRFLTNPIDNIPTTGIVGITFKIDRWKEISMEKVHSSFFEFPKKEQY